MKLINESVWSFKTTQWGAIATLLASIAVLVLQFLLDGKFLNETWTPIATAVIVLISTMLGKKVYQPELHTPNIHEFSDIPPNFMVSKGYSPTPSSELDWIAEGRRYVGLRENTSKTAHNSTILKWLGSLGAWWKEDETPWCGVFVAHCLKVAGVKYPKHWYRALAYIDGGTRLSRPAYGCVAVKTRKGGGHVCFVVGKTKSGKLVCLGGNQNNMVSYALYNESDFSAFRWYGRTSRPADHRYNLPVLGNVSATEVTEA